jgi:hypothetical protein
VILFRVAAWDSNCPQHIPQRFDIADVRRDIAMRDERIAALEAALAHLQNRGDHGIDQRDQIVTTV